MISVEKVSLPRNSPRMEMRSSLREQSGAGDCSSIATKSPMRRETRDDTSEMALWTISGVPPLYIYVFLPQTWKTKLFSSVSSTMGLNSGKGSMELWSRQSDTEAPVPESSPSLSRPESRIPKLKAS